MPDPSHRILEDWPLALERVLEQARALGPRAVVAFDLDSTLFDNRPRQARIVREFGHAHGHVHLTRCEAEHFSSGWDLRGAMRAVGMPADEAERLYPEIKRFWQERFFTSPYCLEDVMIEGAAAFLERVVQTRAQIAYVTGRHEGMREGTVGCMVRYSMPTPNPPQVHLIMKPKLEGSDDAFKREAHAELGRLGTLIAAFDNEPTHANDYRTRFPEAQVIHLATDHSGRPVALLDGIVSVPHFRYA